MAALSLLNTSDALHIRHGERCHETGAAVLARSGKTAGHAISILAGPETKKESIGLGVSAGFQRPGAETLALLDASTLMDVIDGKRGTDRATTMIGVARSRTRLERLVGPGRFYFAVSSIESELTQARRAAREAGWRWLATPVPRAMGDRSCFRSIAERLLASKSVSQIRGFPKVVLLSHDVRFAPLLRSLLDSGSEVVLGGCLRSFPPALQALSGYGNCNLLDVMGVLGLTRKIDPSVLAGEPALAC